MMENFISLKNSRDGELILSMIKSGKIPAAVTVESPNIHREGDDYEFPAAVKPFREDYFTKL